MPGETYVDHALSSHFVSSPILSVILATRLLCLQSQRTNMLFSLVLLGLLEVSQVLALVPRIPAPVAASNDVCKAGIYVALAPLAYYSPAQSFCASKSCVRTAHRV